MTATFDKLTTSESYADVAFTVANGTVTEVKNGSATINASNYTIDGSTVTIKKEYLATQTIGDKTIGFVTGNGTPTAVIAITDTTA